jgi:hypothetical protein
VTGHRRASRGKIGRRRWRRRREAYRAVDRLFSHDGVESSKLGIVLTKKRKQKKGNENRRCRCRRRRRCAAEMDVEAGSRVEMATE